MRILYTLLLALILPVSLSARAPQKGYRGFVDAGADFSFRGGGYGDSAVDIYYGISTSHGYQFNPAFFLGAGVMWEMVHTHSWDLKTEYPFFVHARTDMTFGRVPLYGDLRVGAVLFGDYRFYLSPTIGYRLDLGHKVSFNFGLGMTFRGYGWSDEKTLHPQLSLRAGIDF